MSGWGCPHDLNGICQRVAGRACDPGRKSCVLFGRFVFADERKNERLRKSCDHRREPPADSSVAPPLQGTFE